MHSNNPTQSTPLAGAGYVPYHYASGRFQWYGQLPKTEVFPFKIVPYAKYDFSSDLPVTQHDRGPQTVEQLLDQGYLAVPGSDPETAILHDKKHTSWLGLDDVIAQVRDRMKIYSKNIYEIEQAKCYAVNDLFAWEAEMGRPADYNQRDLLGKRLQKLYSDQRLERVAVWSDVSRLRQALPESVQQYLSSFRKIKMLEDPEGDKQ